MHSHIIYTTRHFISINNMFCVPTKMQTTSKSQSNNNPKQKNKSTIKITGDRFLRRTTRANNLRGQQQQKHHGRNPPRPRIHPSNDRGNGSPKRQYETTSIRIVALWKSADYDARIVPERAYACVGDGETACRDGE